MSFELPPISAKIAGSLDPLTATFAQGVEQGRQFGQNLSRAMKEGSASEDAFAALKGQFAQAQQEMKTLATSNTAMQSEGAGLSSGMAGLGAIGIGFAAASTIDNFAKGAEKFALALDHDRDSAAAAFSEILKGIPIVGQLGDAGERIWNLATGESQYLARIKEATDAQEHHIRTVQALHEAVAKMQKAAEESMQSLRDQIRLLGAEGLEKEFDQIGVGLRKNVEDAAEARRKTLADPAFATVGQDLINERKRLRDLQDQLSNTSATVNIPVSGEGFSDVRVAPNSEFQRLQSDITTAQQHVNDLAKMAQQKDAANAVFNQTLGLSLRLALGKAGDAVFGDKGPFGGDTNEASQGIDHVAEALERLNRQVETFHMNALDRELFDFKHLAGVDDAQVAQATRIIDQLKGLRVDKDLDDFFDSVENGGGKGQKIGSPRLAPLIRAGSAEELRAQFSGGDQQLTELKKHTQILDDIRDAAKDVPTIIQTDVA